MIFNPLAFFRAGEGQAAPVEAGLINSEINKQVCSYVSLQMWRRCIDRHWGGVDTSIPVSSHFPSPNEASWHPSAAFDLHRVTFTPLEQQL